MPVIDFAEYEPDGSAGTAIEVQPITDKLSELNRQRDQVEESLKNVAGKIDLIEAQKISKSTLRKHYNKIAQFYPGMDNKKKRALITALILWIKCKVKKKERKGTLELAFRGDGISTQEWGLDEDPQKIASSLHVDWLRAPLKYTNFFKLRFPIIAAKVQRGEHSLRLNSAVLPDFFDLRKVDIQKLSTALCDGRLTLREQHKSKIKADPIARARQFQAMIDSGIVKNQAQLAVYLGTSRAWVSKVMKLTKDSGSKT